MTDRIQILTHIDVPAGDWCGTLGNRYCAHQQHNRCAIFHKRLDAVGHLLWAKCDECIAACKGETE